MDLVYIPYLHLFPPSRAGFFIFICCCPPPWRWRPRRNVGGEHARGVQSAPEYGSRRWRAAPFTGGANRRFRCRVCDLRVLWTRRQTRRRQLRADRVGGNGTMVSIPSIPPTLCPLCAVSATVSSPRARVCGRRSPRACIDRTNTISLVAVRDQRGAAHAKDKDRCALLFPCFGMLMSVTCVFGQNTPGVWHRCAMIYGCSAADTDTW